MNSPTRAERAGWLTLQRELGDRHRDDVRFAEAIVEDCEALIGRADAIAAVARPIERGARWLRPKRISIGQVSLDPSYAGDGRPRGRSCARLRTARLACSAIASDPAPSCSMTRRTCWPTIAAASATRCPGLLAALGAVQRERPRVRIVLCGLPTLSLNLKRARTYAERMFRHTVGR